MKTPLYILLFTTSIFLAMLTTAIAQDSAVKPALVGTGTYHGLTPPLRDLPALTEAEFKALEAEAALEHNRDLEHRSYPFAETALPTGSDPVWQDRKGNMANQRGLVMNFQGQNSAYYPPDANGAAGPLYYMQSVNSTYTIYNKANGSIVAGPTNMNLLFGNVPGSGCNDGDPLILYDEQADRWLAVEFSICSINDRMLVAVSQTNDPTGSWHAYSFDVDDTPDYEKFGIWRDGYYMGTNNPTGKDIYVFERSQMLVGGTAQFVGFDNPWRPTTIDGFMCVPPLDNDGAFAPAGSPGLFITLADDAIAGGSDQLWIYELSVDWTDPGNATFQRTQQLNVPPFDSNFGTSWDNIDQPGTNQRLDAIPMVIMNRPQYRNFGEYETILCCHTVDVDASNHAGIRWYELRRTNGNWSVRQSGTYAPDDHSRWMGSIALNGNNQIGLAYSISSNTEYPGIRFTGQSEIEYAAASGIMDMEEGNIQTGANSQNGINRWGDYADICVDADNDRTYWFTSQYIGSGGARRTKVAAFEFELLQLMAMFSPSTVYPCEGGTVSFTDESTGSPTSWSWTFEGGTPGTSTEQNPQVTYPLPGEYDVQLVISDGTQSDTLFQEDYVHVLTVPGAPSVPDGPTGLCAGDESTLFTTSGGPNALSFLWTISPAEAGTFAGTGSTAVLSLSEAYTGLAYVKVKALNNCGEGPFSDSLQLTVFSSPMRFNMVPDGGFCQGEPGFEITLDGSETGITYELLRNGITTGLSLPGYGSELSFGYQSLTGIYTIIGHSASCSIEMIDSTNVYFLPAVGTAATPQGPGQVCNSDKLTEYNTAGALNAESYTWSLEPPEAGTVTGNTTVGKVTWNPDFAGTAEVKVYGMNGCGPGALSAGYAVEVVMAPHPSITGNNSVCNANTSSVYFYSTPDNAENEFFWVITSGSLVTGQGTNRVLITWNGTGEGRLTVVESSPNGCETVADTLFVNINDCTGVEESAVGSRQSAVSILPNPTKGVSSFRFQVSGSEHVTLKIYDMLGNEMATVLDETLPAGEHVVRFDASELPAGVYLYELAVGSQQSAVGKVVKF